MCRHGKSHFETRWVGQGEGAKRQTCRVCTFCEGVLEIMEVSDV